MARTSQANAPKYTFHKAKFVDHTGQEALRLRSSTTTEPIPDDFHEHPVFCFQIYSTVPLDLEGTNNEAYMATQYERLKDSDNARELISYLAHMMANDAQRTEPVWEVYAPQADVFACIEHQKREIAYRKARRDDPRTFLVPKLALRAYESRKSGFLFVINSLNYQGSRQRSQDEVDANGPLWVWFDRRFSDATAAEQHLRWRNDPKPTYFADEKNVLLPEKEEVRVRRVQRPSGMPHDLRCHYELSCYGGGDGEADLEADFALEVEEGGRGGVDPGAELRLIEDLQGLSIPHLHTEIVEGGIVVSNHSAAEEPALRYIIYVPLLRPALGLIG